MTQEEKQLLLKDLCVRLPYGLKCYCKIYDEDSDGFPLDTKHDGIGVLCTIYTDEGDSYYVEFIEGIARYNIEEVKPYLRPMSSMTNDEMVEFDKIKENPRYIPDKSGVSLLIPSYVDWLNSHHFDYRGLIEKGLALPAPGGMYNI